MARHAPDARQRTDRSSAAGNVGKAGIPSPRMAPDRQAGPVLSRRLFLALTGATTLGLFLKGPGGSTLVHAEPIPGGTLLPEDIAKFVTPLLVPPAMPRAGKLTTSMGKNADYYEIAVRQFPQQILPAGMPATTVWGYGPAVATNGPQIFNAPSLTIESKAGKPAVIKWVNELVDANGNYLPHLLTVDPTLHWANPPGGTDGRDTRPTFTSTPGPYTGPVPLVTHVHGAVGVGDESDGYAEAWYLPAANDIPAGYATEGTWYDFFAEKAATADYAPPWDSGYAYFRYPNDNRASTLWYHDHTLGMTRLNVYAGPAGFYIVRGGPSDIVLDAKGKPAVLPGPAPALGDAPGTTYYEIPIVIQDRSFNYDGSLFYPDTREFFDEIIADYIPNGKFSPYWNPEFFGNTMMVNGNTWPTHTVEQRRYRFRFLNGCQSRFLILDFNQIPGVQVWQIGNEGGFLAAPVDVTAAGNTVLMGLAERADVIVDFANVPAGNYVLGNLGPDEPFGGGAPEDDFDSADPGSTGQVMQFSVVATKGKDPTTPPAQLVLPAITPLPAEDVTRPLALIEKMGEGEDADGTMVEGPVEAVLGTVGPDSIDDSVSDGVWTERLWMDPVTENPAVGATEMWEFYNTTGDAHPMHIHEVVFEVVNREGLVLDEDGEVVEPIELDGVITPPEAWETGFKDTVIAYPGQVTRVKMRFTNPGQFVWHCHIVEHEDNEMMRPFRIGLDDTYGPTPMQPPMP
jgi:FtsP/CotA-like multicopper oxidase with cupredoxin domain